MDVVAQKRSPLERKAFKMWCAAGRPRQLKWIAEKLGVSPEMVRKWKHYYKWEEREDPRPGAPRGNKNAVGNKGGAPKGNQNAVKHGLYRKYMPQDEEFLEVFDLAAEADPLDMLWHSIVMKFTAIIRAQKIMFVRDRDDVTKELKKVKEGGVITEREWEIQFAWDKYANFLKAQAAAISTLNSLIRQFLNAAPEEDERRTKIELMRAQIAKVKAETKELEDPERAGIVNIIDDVPPQPRGGANGQSGTGS